MRSLPPVGARVSLRRLDPDGTARDLVGDVVEADDRRLRVLPWDRGPVDVEVSSVAAWRRVPPKAVRPASTPADVARLAARGWPGLDVERLGGWELRAAGGYTRRANSALCEGDPETDLTAAVARTVTFYRTRDLAAQVMLPARPDEPHPLRDPLMRQGWREHTPTRLLTRDLRLSPPASVPDGLRVSWSARPTPQWLAAFGRPHPLREAVLTAADADYLSLRRDDALVGIARLAVTGEWAGISGLWVADPQRGRGLGAGLMGVLAERARYRGARFGYLQVVDDNVAARRLYDRLGWQVHHRSTYLTLE